MRAGPDAGSPRKLTKTKPAPIKLTKAFGKSPKPIKGAKYAKSLALTKKGPPKKLQRVGGADSPAVRPSGDTKSAGEFERAATFKKTAHYRGSVRKAYLTKSDKARHERIADAKKQTSAEAKAILHEHTSRLARNRALKAAQAKHDVYTDADRKKVREHVQTPEYKKALSDAAYAGATREGKDLRHAAQRAADAAERARAGAKTAKVQAAAALPDTALDKTVGKLRKQTSATAVKVLDQVSRPGYGAAGGAYAALEGKNVIDAAGRGLRLKERKRFGDVLKKLGAPKAVQAVGGFALDVVADPTTYVTFGTASAAKQAATKALRAELAAGAKKVAAGSVTKAAADRAALAKARAVYDAAKETEKHRGLKVGVRAGRKRVMSKPIGGGVTKQAKSLGRTLARPLDKPEIRELADKTKRSLVHDARRADLEHELNHEYVRDAARRFRAKREAGDRRADARARAIHKAVKGHKLSDQDQAAIIRALERKDPGDLRGVGRELYETIERDLREAGEKEVARGIRGPLGKGPRPHVPEVTADPTITRRELDLSLAELRAQKKVRDDSLRGAGVSRGRANVLSRTVNGRKAEKAAEKRVPEFAAGGHGVQRAEGLVAKSEANVAKATEDAKAALARHRAEVEYARAQRTARRQAEKAVAEHVRKPVGYFPRHVREEEFIDPDTGRYFPKSGGDRQSGTSLNRRQHTEALEHMTEAQRAKYDLRLDASVGRRLQEHGRMMALADLHDSMAALGKRIDNVDDLPERATDLQRVLVRDRRGFVPLYDKFGKIDVKRAEQAIEEGREVVQVPKAEWEALNEYRQRGRNVGEIHENPLLRGFDKTQGTVKTLQTVVNPGYHMTNLIGDTFNARLGGARGKDFARGLQLKRAEGTLDRAMGRLDETPRGQAFERAAARTEKYGDETLSDLDLVREAIEVGAVKTGFGGNELRALVREGDVTKRTTVRDKLAVVSEKREDAVRLASYYSARKRGMSADEAADWVNKHHFDYGDLTEVERGFFRRVIPFYTFMARNTRLQAGALGRTPGSYAHLQAARDESAKAAGENPEWDKALQRFEQQGLPFVLPAKVGGFKLQLYPKLPVMDLNNLTGSPSILGENIAQRMSVLLKTPLEQFAKYNTFTRSLYNKERVPAPNYVKIPGVRAAINDAFRTIGIENAIVDIEDRRTGKMVPGWSWRVDQLMRQVPAVNALANATTPTRHQRPQDWKLALAGYFGGARPVQLDKTKVKVSQLWNELEDLASEVAELRQQVPGHKPGKEWTGKIGKLNEKIADRKRSIYKLEKQQGYVKPSGLAPKKGRRSKPKAFGAAGGGQRKKSYFGAGG